MGVRGAVVGCGHQWREERIRQPGAYADRLSRHPVFANHHSETHQAGVKPLFWYTTSQTISKTCAPSGRRWRGNAVSRLSRLRSHFAARRRSYKSAIIDGRQIETRVPGGLSGSLIKNSIIRGSVFFFLFRNAGLPSKVCQRLDRVIIGRVKSGQPVILHGGPAAAMPQCHLNQINF